MNRIYDVEDFSATMRATVQEFGRDCLEKAIIIDCEYREDCHTECGLPYIYAPTVTGPKLINVDYKVAKFFEDFYIRKGD